MKFNAIDSDEKKNVLLSMIVPMYNEALVIDLFFSTLLSVLQSTKLSFEIICVNDGSRDDTLIKLIEYQKTIKELVIVDFSRNFGKEAALTAGLTYCKGEFVIPIDADLQHPPELISLMLDKAQEGFDQVLAIPRGKKQENFLKNLTSRSFYRAFNRISDWNIPENAGDFRLISRKVVDALLLLPEKNRFMKGLFSWVGFKTTQIDFEIQKRAAGKTSYSYFKLWRFALDGIFSFSSFPLRISTYLGLLISFFSGFYIIWLILKTLIYGRPIPGYASLIVIILFMGAVQLLSLGIIGEYVSRIYNESKQRPLYIIKKIYVEN